MKRCKKSSKCCNKCYNRLLQCLKSVTQRVKDVAISRYCKTLESVTIRGNMLRLMPYCNSRKCKPEFQVKCYNRIYFYTFRPLRNIFSGLQQAKYGVVQRSHNCLCREVLKAEPWSVEIAKFKCLCREVQFRPCSKVLKPYRQVLSIAISQTPLHCHIAKSHAPC